MFTRLRGEIELADRTDGENKRGGPGTLTALRRAHLGLLAEAEKLEAEHATAREAVHANRDLSDLGKEKALAELSAEQTTQRTELLAKRAQGPADLLEARERALLDQLPAPEPDRRPSPTEARERAQLFLSATAAMEPSDFVQAVLSVVERADPAGPDLLRAAAVRLTGDEAHATKLAGLVAAAFEQRAASRVAQVFADPHSPRARAAAELALLRQVAELTELDRDVLAAQPASADVLAKTRRDAWSL